MDDVSPRVNAARLKDYVGASHPIRMTGKVLNVRPLITAIRITGPCVSHLSPSPRQTVLQRRNVLYYGGP